MTIANKGITLPFNRAARLAAYGAVIYTLLSAGFQALSGAPPDQVMQATFSGVMPAIFTGVSLDLLFSNPKRNITKEENKLSLKNVFDWLSKQPKKQYTLGEALFGRDDPTTLPFNRGGRIAERIVTAASVITGAAMMLTGNPLGLAFVMNGKLLGLGSALVAEVAGEIVKPNPPPSRGHGHGFRSFL